MAKGASTSKKDYANLSFDKSVNGIIGNKQYADNLTKFVSPDSIKIDLSPDNIDKFLSKHWIELMEVCYDLIQEIFLEIGNIQISEDIQILLKHLKSISNRAVTDHFFDNLFNKEKLHLDQNWFKYRDRIDTLEKQKKELKKEIEEVNELMMGMTDNSQSMTSGQGRSRHQSIDLAETQKDTSRNIGSDLKNNDTADFAKNLPEEKSTEKPVKGVPKIMTLRSKIDDEPNTTLIEDSKRDQVKKQEKDSKFGRKVSVRSKKDGDFKMSEKFTSQHSNQETPEEHNFSRTNSKISNPKILNSKKSLVFMRSKNKMSMKEELQLLQDIKDLEKEKEFLTNKVKDLQEALSEAQKDTIKWKFIMSQKVITLEDKIENLKNTQNAQKHMLKEDYSKDLIKISKLSKKKEEMTISNIKAELEAEFKDEISKIKDQYEDQLARLAKEIDQSKKKYQELVAKGEREEVKEEGVLKDFYGGIVVCFEGEQVSVNRVKYSLESMLGAQFQVVNTDSEKILSTSPEASSNSITKFYLKSTSNNLQTLNSHISSLKSLLPSQSPLRSLSPLYLSFTYGKSPQKPLTPTTVLLQEGIYLNSTYLLLTISKHPNLLENTVSLQLLAFNIQTDTQYILLLTFSDLIKITRGRLADLDSPGFPSFIVKNLDFTLDDQGQQALVFEDRFYFAEHEPEVGLSAVQDQEGIQPCAVGSQTEYEANVGYEPYDVCMETGILGLKLIVQKGRVSRILCLRFLEKENEVAKLWVKFDKGRIVTGEVVYQGEVPKWVVGAETLGKGNFRVKVCASDLREGVEEVVVLETKQNGDCICHRDIDKDILDSEERFCLFREIYGHYQANIDFSTFKFRKFAGFDPNKVLLCRVVCQIKVQRIKQSVMDRADFEEYIESYPEEIYDPIAYNFAVVSLFGKYDEDDKSISSVTNIAQPMSHHEMTSVVLEICVQTDKESIKLTDKKDQSFIIHRNRGNIDNTSRDLKNLIKHYKIKDINHSPKLIKSSEIKSEFESWEESNEESISLVPPGVTAIKSQKIVENENPEVPKKTLKQSESYTKILFLQSRVYTCTIYYLASSVYVEAYSTLTKKHHTLMLQEADLLKVLYYSSLPEESLFDQKSLVADVLFKCIGMTEAGLVVSKENYEATISTEKRLAIEVSRIGGQLTKSKQGQEPSALGFESRLVLTEEREFSSGYYSIRIFERKFKELGKMAYRFELSLAPPRISEVFVVDFEVGVEKRMNRILMETIGLEDRNEKSSEGDEVVFMSSVVLSIFENSFPHFVEFTLMEPSTKVEWSHKISTNSISSLVLKEKFAKVVYYNVKEGPYRSWNSSDRVKISSLLYENLHALEFEENLEKSIMEGTSQKIDRANKHNFKKDYSQGVEKPKIFLFKGDFNSKIALNSPEQEDVKVLQSEDLDEEYSKPKPSRLYLDVNETGSSWELFRKLESLKDNMDIELSISSHSNGYLKLVITVLENDEVTKTFETWVSYSNWEENTRVYSEIIQANPGISFILYYESFTVGGSNGRVQTESESEISLNDDKSSISERQLRQEQRGFRVQLKRMLYKNNSRTLFDVMMIDESTLNTDDKLIEDVWNDILGNYSNIQTLIEDSMSNSLFSQFLNKGNTMLSDEEDTHDESPLIKTRKEKIKEGILESNTEIANYEVEKTEELFEHYYMDSNNEEIVLKAMVLLVHSTKTLKIITEDPKTLQNSSFLIPLKTYLTISGLKSLVETSGSIKTLIEDHLKPLFNLYTSPPTDPSSSPITFTPSQEIALQSVFPDQFNHDLSNATLEDYIVTKKLQNNYSIDF